MFCWRTSSVVLLSLVYFLCVSSTSTYLCSIPDLWRYSIAEIICRVYRRAVASSKRFCAQIRSIKSPPWREHDACASSVVCLHCVVTSYLAQFGDEVVAVVSLHDFEETDHILVTHRLQQPALTSQVLSDVSVSLCFLLVNHLDGHLQFVQILNLPVT